MPAKTSLFIFLSKFLRAHRALYLLALAAAVALSVWASRLYANGASSASSALAPGLRLAMGTVELEDGALAVDAESAARLLPLWKLLADLSSSGTPAPQEVSAVIEEIRLSMTSAQIEAIDRMSFSPAELASSGSSARAAATPGASGSTGVDPMLGAELSAGSAPMEGGAEPPPSMGAQENAASAGAPASSRIPAAIRQVIQLLQTKTQNAAQS